MTVDRMTPYRYFTILVILGASAVVYSVVVAVKRATTQQITSTMSEFPHTRVLSMAVIEAAQFAGLYISAAGVTPTMTLILLHANTISNVFLSKFVFPNRQFSLWQMRGVYLITAAILVSLGRPMMHLLLGTRETEARCSLWYILSACVLGISNLYKEHCVISWKEPMDIHYLSSWLYLYQLLVSVIMAPLLYYFQNVSVIYDTVTSVSSLPETNSTGQAQYTVGSSSNNVDAYPLSMFWDNMRDGLGCVLKGESEILNITNLLQDLRHHHHHSHSHRDGYSDGSEEFAPGMGAMFSMHDSYYYNYAATCPSEEGVGASRYIYDSEFATTTAVYTGGMGSGGRILTDGSENTANGIPTDDVINYSYDHDLLCKFCNCHGGLWLILVFIMSNLMVCLCIDKVLQKAGHIIDRALAVSIFTAFIALGIYDTKVVDENNGGGHPYGGLLFGTSIGYADVISIIILIIGIEVHGRHPVPDTEAVSQFALTEIKPPDPERPLTWS